MCPTRLAGVSSALRPASSGYRISASPGWVCEILAATTAHLDLGTKKRSYHRAGVECYWVLDPADTVLAVLSRVDEGYRVLLTAGRDARVSAEPLADVAIDMRERFTMLRS